LSSALEVLRLLLDRVDTDEDKMTPRNLMTRKWIVQKTSKLEIPSIKMVTRKER